MTAWTDYPTTGFGSALIAYAGVEPNRLKTGGGEVGVLATLDDLIELMARSERGCKLIADPSHRTRLL